MMKPNVIIAGDEIRAGIDIEDVERTGPIQHAVVITFDTEQQMAQALQSGSIDFDLMRDDGTSRDTTWIA